MIKNQQTINYPVPVLIHYVCTKPGILAEQDMDGAAAGKRGEGKLKPLCDKNVNAYKKKDNIIS